MIDLPKVNVLLRMLELQVSPGNALLVADEEDDAVPDDQHDVEEVCNVQEVVRPLHKMKKMKATNKSGEVLLLTLISNVLHVLCLDTQPVT